MRKRFFVMSLLAVMVFFIGASPVMAQKKLVVCVYGGAWGEHLKKVLFEPFEKETGIKVIQAVNPEVGKIKAMVTSGNVEWDVVEQGTAMMFNEVQDNLLEKIDYSYIDNKTLSGFDVSMKHPYGIGFIAYSVVIAYDKKVFPETGPRSWKDFWDVKKFPGPRCLKSGAGSGYAPIEEALLADGVSIDKLYPCDIDRAFKSLDRIKPHVVKWWTTGAQAPQLLTDREVVMVEAYNGRINDIKKQGANVELVWNQGRLSTEVLTIPRGTKNYKEAMQFIAFCSRADNQAAMSTGYPNGAANRLAYNIIPADIANNLPTSPQNIKQQFLFNDKWWVEKNRSTGRTNLETVKEIWDAWILK